MPAAVLDTGFLLAAAAPNDLNHHLARAAMRELTGVRVAPVAVLPELSLYGRQPGELCDGSQNIRSHPGDCFPN